MQSLVTSQSVMLRHFPSRHQPLSELPLARARQSFPPRGPHLSISLAYSVDSDVCLSVDESALAWAASGRCSLERYLCCILSRLRQLLIEEW